MKLLALFVCVAFLYGVSSETSDLGDSATAVAADDATEDRAVAVEFDDFTEDDDTAEMDDEADLDWDDDQTDEDWDEEHAFPLMYEDQYQYTDALEPATSPEVEWIRFRCRGLRCCLSTRIFRRGFSACLRGFYRNNRIGYKVTVNGRTFIQRSVRVGANEIMYCKKFRIAWFLKKTVCAGLTDINIRRNGYRIQHISARAKIQVRGRLGFTKKTKPFTLYRRR
ncbi:uncharacterized protein LOC110989054 [Acanthaster planci]|uniref:Uncharacterized protein LOC110989054 n=1 Tax=Acanthaster planci TaxID=133434 RepID=A0A8B7ZTE4_ACAPL|nr:uncharacterized protein LOC110989054 [Acanthaster planci]